MVYFKKEQSLYETLPPLSARVTRALSFISSYKTFQAKISLRSRTVEIDDTT